LLLIILLGLYWTQANTDSIMAQAGTGIIRVATTGNDALGCGSTASPCRTIQYAINAAPTGTTILVAAGTYTYDAASDSCSSVFFTTSVVCVANKHLALLGGYTTSNWNTADPMTNVTIIDGANTYRGIFWVGTTAATSLRLEGFIIQNGLAKGISARSGNDAIFAFGGGLFADMGSNPGVAGPLALRDVIFKNNKSIGENTGTGYGGTGAGGGLDLRHVSNVTLERVTFQGNEARGGTGVNRGGYGNGGAIHTDHSIITGNYVTFTNNLAVGGNTSGSGVNAGEYADGVGGGLSVQIQSSATLQNVYATGNIAMGGNSAGTAGGAYGGAFFAEVATLNLTDAYIAQNQAVSGSAPNAWLAGGGGVETINANLSLNRTYVISNTARTGISTNGTSAGSPGGGGLYLTRAAGNTTIIDIQNSVIANNTAQFGGAGSTTMGGGGGGIWLQGTSATIAHTTIAGNSLGANLFFGQGVLLLNYGAASPSTASFATISYSILADHTNNAALHVLPGGNTVTLNRGLYAGNTQDDNSGDPPANRGTYTIINPMLTAGSAGFISSGAPNYNYHLTMSSAARDQATGSAMTIDIDRDTRSSPDIGADEYVPLPLTGGGAGISGTVQLNWQPNAGLSQVLGSYEVVVTCPIGSSPPDQGACGSGINAGTATSFVLTGLTNNDTYTFTVNVKNGSNTTVSSATVNAMPFIATNFVYLPIVIR
jgi:hypothetical protein